MFARLPISLLCLLTVSAPATLRAQVVAPQREQAAPTSAGQPLQVEVRTQRKVAATHSQDPSASGTSIDLTDRTTLPRNLGDVVRESPGAQVVSTGGIGASSTLSLRSAADDETLVLLDEIPLSTPDGGAFDLSLFPADLFDQANVFRGGTPVWLGSGSIGGVLQLVPHRGGRNRLNLSAGIGSYGTYQAGGGTEVSTKSGLTAHSQLFIRSTQGNYPYRDQGGTLFDKSDDRTFRLKNADFLEASGMQDLTFPVGRGTLHMVALGLQRGGGFPGPAAAPTPKIRRESSRAIGAAAYTIEGGSDQAWKRKLQVVASGAFGADRFTDLYGQLGVSNITARDNRSLRAFVRSAGSLSVTRWLEGTLIGSYAYDRYLPFDYRSAKNPDPSFRSTAAGAAELLAHGSLGRTRFELRPSARAEWSHTHVSAPEDYRGPLDSSQNVMAKTARVGLSVAPLSWLAVSASAATGKRLPTIFELFGDGGRTLPSPNLKPVSSTTVDGGLSLKGRVGIARGRAELRGFWLERHDAIVPFRTAQFQVGYRNLGSTRSIGTESNVTGSLTDYFWMSSSFTWLDAETPLGKRVPLRPRTIAYVRPEGRLKFDNRWVSGASVSSELWHRSFAYVDLPNQAYTPACTKLAFSAALGLLQDRFRFSARMDDALDARCFDVVGYPLPGRTLFFSLSYQEIEHEES